MDKKIKNAERGIEKKTKKEFKGLLKEDHKIDNKVERLEKRVKTAHLQKKRK